MRLIVNESSYQSRLKQREGNGERDAKRTSVAMPGVNSDGFLLQQVMGVDTQYELHSMSQGEQLRKILDLVIVQNNQNQAGSEWTSMNITKQLVSAVYVRILHTRTICCSYCACTNRMLIYSVANRMKMLLVYLPVAVESMDHGVVVDMNVEKEAMLVLAQAVHSIVSCTAKVIESWKGRAGWEEMSMYIPSSMASVTGTVENKSVDASSQETADSESVGNSYEAEVAHLNTVNLEIEKAELDAANGRLTKEVELLHQQALAKDMRVNETEGAVAILSERMESLQLEISKLENERRDESIKMEMEKQEKNRLRDEVSALKMEMDMNRSKLGETEMSCTRLEAAIKTLTHQAEELRQAVAEKESEVDETKTAMEKLNVEMEKEKRETDRLREKVVKYEEKLECSERNETKNASEIVGLRDELKELVETKTKLTKENTTVKAELVCAKATHAEWHKLMLERSIELQMELDKLKEKTCRYKRDEVVALVRASDKDGETIDACVTKCDKYTKMAELKERMLVFEGESLHDTLIETTPHGMVDFEIHRADLETFHHYFGMKENSQHLKRTVSDE